MDYRKLHTTSTVDLLSNVYKNYRPRKRKSSRIYEVERLIAKRKGLEGSEYLVKWSGYTKYDASWEMLDNISPECIRLFEKPEPGRIELLQAVDSFRCAVESRLKSKSRLPLTIDFPSHIYKYLFESKEVIDGGWLYLEEEHFSKTYFPKNWDQCLNSFGEGHKICYPVKMRFFLAWSPKKYIKQDNGELFLCTRAFQERLSFSFARSPC